MDLLGSAGSVIVSVTRWYQGRVLNLGNDSLQQMLVQTKMGNGARVVFNQRLSTGVLEAAQRPGTHLF